MLLDEIHVAVPDLLALESLRSVGVHAVVLRLPGLRGDREHVMIKCDPYVELSSATDGRGGSEGHEGEEEDRDERRH